MAETLVKTPTCSKCGEDARPQALFCHACGGQIIDLVPEDEEDVSSAWFRGDIVDAADPGGNQTAAAVGNTPAEKLEGDPVELVVRSGQVQPDPATAVSETPKERISVKSEGPDVRESGKKLGEKKLTSAAELRKRPKSVRTKRVEITWEENTGSPNILFLVFGVLLAVLAGVIFFLALYLK